MKRKTFPVAAAFVVACIFLSSASAAFGQKLYLISAGDFQASKVAQCVRAGVRLVEGTFKSALPEHRLVIYNDPDGSSWTGPDVCNSSSKKRDLLRAIAACPVGPNDSLVCFWCSHGAFDDQGQYFAVDGNPIYRSVVRKALEAKGARFTALISESCHNYLPSSIVAGVGAGVPEDVPPIFQSLFFTSRGTLDINSASPGQTAIADGNVGGAFTYSLSYLLQYESERRLSWNQAIKRIDSLVDEFEPRANQTVYVWSLPSGGSNVPENRSNQWSEPRYHPENGDRIIAVNDNKIYDESDFRAAVYDSPSVVVLTLIDKRSGNKYYLKTTLWPRGSSTRLGVYVAEDGGQGVVVTGVWANSPGNRCQYLQNGDVQPVRSSSAVGSAPY